MVLKIGSKAIKHTLAQRHITKELKKFSSKVYHVPVTRVSILLDENNIEALPNLVVLKDNLNIIDENFLIYIHSNNNQIINGIEGEIFSDKTINLFGKLNNTKFDVLSSKGVDLLITFAEENNVAVNLVTASSSAGIKVGRQQGEKELFDLVIQCENDVQLFVIELLKFIKCLK